MNKRLNKVIQFAIPTIQQITRDLSKCDPLPQHYQRWMCPNCNHVHPHDPIELEEYECDCCTWHGDRNHLLIGDTSCLKQASSQPLA